MSLPRPAFRVDEMSLFGSCHVEYDNAGMFNMQLWEFLDDLGKIVD